MAVMKIASQLNLLDDVADNGSIEAALSASDTNYPQNGSSLNSVRQAGANISTSN
jgi:hypothetical protein